MWGFHPLSKASYMDALTGTNVIHDLLEGTDE